MTALPIRPDLSHASMSSAAAHQLEVELGEQG